MKFKKVLENGKVMTICLSCNVITHSYRGRCNGCGETKGYDFFFTLEKEERKKLIKTLIDYNRMY